MEFVKKSFAQFRTIGKDAIVVSGNHKSAPITTGESAITSDVPTVTPIQYAGNTGKEFTMDPISCENAAQALFECVQGQMHDPNSVCIDQQEAERIACTPSGNDSAVEVVDSAAVQYAGNTGKEFTMNKLQNEYVWHLGCTMDYPATDDLGLIMRRRSALRLAVASMSTVEILMDSTFVRGLIKFKVRRAVRMSRVSRFLRWTAMPWMSHNPTMHNIYALLGTPSFVKDELIDTYWGYETSCAEIVGGYNGDYDSDEAMQADIDQVLEFQRRIGAICARLDISLCAAVPATTDVPMVTQNAYAGDTGKETVMTDERLFACTNPSIAQDYLTCKGEMTFTEAYDACGELLDEAYIHGCCETFADDCQQHERLFQQDADQYAEYQCDICLAIYSWEEDAASGSCSQDCGGGAEQDLPDSTDEYGYVGLITEDGTVTRIPDGESYVVMGFHN